jgi:hypothetical protein
MRDQSYPKEMIRNGRTSAEQITFQMMTITYNDEAVPWNRSNHLIRTKLPPSSDGSDNFSGGGLEPLAELR